MPGGTCELFPSLTEQREREEKRKLREEEILSGAIKKWGMDAQAWMVIEEMSELAKEICKTRRGKNDLEALADEIADVEIMLAQLKMMFSIKELVSAHRKAKMARLERRLEKSQ